MKGFKRYKGYILVKEIAFADHILIIYYVVRKLWAIDGGIVTMVVIK